MIKISNGGHPPESLGKIHNGVIFKMAELKKNIFKMWIVIYCWKWNFMLITYCIISIVPKVVVLEL